MPGTSQVSTGTGTPKGVTLGDARPNLVLGSRPMSMRAPRPPNPMTGSGRIAPMTNQRDYAKTATVLPPANPLGQGR